MQSAETDHVETSNKSDDDGVDIVEAVDNASAEIIDRNVMKPVIKTPVKPSSQPCHSTPNGTPSSAKKRYVELKRT